MKVRGLSTILAILMVAAGCGGQGTVETTADASSQTTGVEGLSGEIDLIMPESTTQDREYWDTLIASFESDNPEVTVNLEMVPWGDIGQRVDTLIATNQPPDLLGINVFASYAADGLLNDMTEVVSPETLADFVPNLLPDGQLDGTQYALPWVASITMFAVNQELFDQAGVTDVPTTWDDLREAARAVRDETGKIGFAIRMGPIGATEALTLALFGNGGDWVSDGELQINTPEALEALNFLRDLHLEDQVTNVNPASADHELYDLFAQGEIGMSLGASFFPSLIDPVNPDLDYELVAVPVSRPDLTPTALVIQDYVMSFKTDNDPRLGGLFLDYYLRAANLVPYQNLVGGLPGTISGQEVMAADDPVMAGFIPLFETAKFYPNTHPAWPDVNTAMLQQLGLVVAGETDAQETLDALQVIAERSR